MPRELLTIGEQHTLVVGQVYALPTRAVYIHAQGGTLELSNDGTTWTALAAINPIAAGLIRTTVADSIVFLKAD